LDEAVALYEKRRKRRRQRRLVAVLGFVMLTTGLAWFFELQATTTIIVTRYANVLVAGGDDAGLSPHGQVRAQEIARLLGAVDVVAGVDAIYVAPNRRARDTSVPISMINDAPVHTVEDPSAVEELVARILTEYKGKIILLITEPELMQPVIAEMHGSKKLPPIEEGEFDNLYIVSIPWFGKVKTLRLKYGDRYIPEG
jgi:hypothetical protein